MNTGRYGAGQQYNEGKLPYNVKIVGNMRNPTPLPNGESKTAERLKQLQMWNEASQDDGLNTTIIHNRNDEEVAVKKTDDFNPSQKIGETPSFHAVAPPKAPGIFDDYDSDSGEEDADAASPRNPEPSPKNDPPPPPPKPVEAPTPIKSSPSPAAASPPKESSGGCCVLM